VGVNLTSTSVAARVPNGDARWLRYQAEARGVNVSTFLAEIIREHRREKVGSREQVLGGDPLSRRRPQRKG
jgi:hypothetical protein